MNQKTTPSQDLTNAVKEIVKSLSKFVASVIVLWIIFLILNSFSAVETKEAITEWYDWLSTSSFQKGFVAVSVGLVLWLMIRSLANIEILLADILHELRRR